jgi:mono/diheme cytochrome c family protein
MTTRARLGLAAALAAIAVATASAQYQGWLIPIESRGDKSPLTPSPQIAREGQALFQTHCARCHGPEGRGNGPDSDHAADLTDELRDQINTDGVLFYKIWNGHAVQLRTQIDDMPAFKDTLTRDQVWRLVEHLKVLRTPQR